MTAFELFDRRSFSTKMEMAMAVLARKRPLPTQEEQAEAFQPILDYILANQGQAPVTKVIPSAPVAQAEEPDRPLQPHERITPQTLDQIFQETAPHINSMLTKVDATGRGTPNREFNVVFDRNEGMHIQELPMYLDRDGSQYVFINNEGFNPQRGWVVKIGKR